MVVLIDCGHGVDTAGKRSPDGVVREGVLSRIIGSKVFDGLKRVGVQPVMVAPTCLDTELNKRVKDVNRMCDGRDDVILLSIHLDAKGDMWNSATGLTTWVAPNASETSKRWARAISEKARARGLCGNRAIQAYHVGDFAICRDTHCPAILIETCFMTERDTAYQLMAGDLTGRIADCIASVFG